MNALRMLVALAILTAMLVAFYARLGEPGLQIAMPFAFLAGARIIFGGVFSGAD